MTINFLNDLVVDDIWLDSQTPEDLKVWLENYAQSIGLDVKAWVCPLTNRIIAFGNTEPNWREELNGN